MNVFIYSPCAGELMHLIANNQSGLENKQNNTLLFFISLCPWNVLSYKIVSLAVCCVCVSCKYYRAHYVWWLEIDLNKVGGEGAGKRGQGERAGCSCFACTGASVGEGVDRAPQCCFQLSDNSCSERGDVLRVMRHVSLFFHLSSHLSASSFHQTDMRQTRVQHTVFPTFTQIRRHDREIHKKLAGCLHTHKTLKINQEQPSFDGICYLFLSLGQLLMKKNHQLFNGN